MNSLLNRQLDELLSTSSMRSTNLKCEGALRVGAATLCRAAPNEITATTVVCDLAGDDLDTFEFLVQEIADEYGVEVRIRPRHGSYSVRFSWPRPPVAPVHMKEAEKKEAEKSMLARLLRR